MAYKEKEPYNNVPRQTWDVLMMIIAASHIMGITVTFFRILKLPLQLPSWLRIQVLSLFLCTGRFGF